MHWKLADHLRAFFALESSAEGWVAASFAQKRGSMIPADAVIGWANSTYGEAAGFRISEKHVRGVVEDETVVSRLGLADFSTELINGKTIIRFSRSSHGIQNGDIAMNFAVHPHSDALQYHGDGQRAPMLINLAAGTSSEADELKRARRQHGVLMIAAWCWLAPWNS
eukprot:gene56988-biopygen84161